MTGWLQGQYDGRLGLAVSRGPLNTNGSQMMGPLLKKHIYNFFKIVKQNSHIAKYINRKFTY